VAPPTAPHGRAESSTPKCSSHKTYLSSGDSRRTPLDRIIIALGVFLVIGAAATAYSFTQLQGQTVIFDQRSIPMDGQPYVVRVAIVDLTGKYGATVTGSSGSAGCCADFYLLNATSWNMWIADPAAHASEAMVHQNSNNTFSFPVASSEGLMVTFVNDQFPAPSNAVAQSTLTLHYTSLYAVYGIIVGATIMAICLILALIRFRRAPTFEHGNTPPPPPPQPPIRNRPD